MLHNHFEQPIITDFDKIQFLPHDVNLSTDLNSGLTFAPYSGTPNPDAFITPYMSPSQGGNANVPVGQTGAPVAQNFIGPVQNQTGTVGQPVSTVQNQTGTVPQNNPSPASQTTNTNPHINPATGLWDDNYYASHSGSSGGNSMDSGTASYISQLNDILNNGLPAEAASQNATQQSAYDLGATTAQSNRTSSEGTINTATAKNLKDLGTNMQNLFQGGNVYLGARGAGDSSAANQYSFALTQMGSKQRASILSDATSRLGQIGDIYNNQMAQLKSDLDTHLSSISSWLMDAQNQIKNQIGSIGYQAAQQQSQNALNMAIAAANNVASIKASNQSALETWAANNSKTAQEFISNLNTVSQGIPTYGSLNGMPQVSGGSTAMAPNLTGAAGTGHTYDEWGNQIS